MVDFPTPEQKLNHQIRRASIEEATSFHGGDEVISKSVLFIDEQGSERYIDVIVHLPSNIILGEN